MVGGGFLDAYSEIFELRKHASHCPGKSIYTPEDEEIKYSLHLQWVGH